MRLVKNEIDKRVDVRLDKSIKSDGNNNLGIMKFGENNDYPQIIERLVNGSITAKSISNIYSKFLTGKGFENEEINNQVIGVDSRGKSITISSLLRQVADSIAMFNGCYIHNNVNLSNDIVNSKLVPFKDVRFSKIDSVGYTAKLAVYKNWDKEVKFDSKEISWFNVTTNNFDAFISQVNEVENIENYNGQIFFHFLDNQFIYPLSPFDPVYMDCDTESQISLFKNRQIRNGLLDKVVFRVQSPSTDSDRQDLHNGIRSFIGADGDNVLILEDEIDPSTGEIKKAGAFVIDKIESSINDKLFESWEKALMNNIRKANKALPSVLIDYDESKLGSTSGEGITQAVNFYNAMTFDDRQSISEMFKEIFSRSINPVLRSNTNWTIKELSLYKVNETSTMTFVK